MLLPNKALWLTDHERELFSFPGSKFDDQVDSTTQALDYLGQRTSLDVGPRSAGKIWNGKGVAIVSCVYTSDENFAFDQDHR